MPKISVNGKEVEFEQGMTILQACEVAGAEIPRFCYHERLKIAGNCRMCLVEVEGGPPKPAASCAMPAADGMKVHTDSPMVKKAREGVMEFLLINHPLDCPICDQGGECDLQDQAMAYGKGDSRYGENKRSVKEKNMGPLVKTQMTRCIQCTRCVRFLEDISGIVELGMVNRGEHAEITTYVEKSLTSELSGNIIDLCPVGALTSKPYAFKSRPWELNKTETIDVLDAVGSNIRVDSRGMEVLRILPRLNEDINEEWISDKTRFAYDGLRLQRLDRPYVRKNGKLKPASWDEAFVAIANELNGLSGAKIAAIAGDLADCESMFALKNLMDKLDSKNTDCRQDGVKLSNKNRADYLFNTSIAGIEEADICLIIGANPRYDAPILNARIRKAVVNNNMQVAYVGAGIDLNYKYNDLGVNPKVLDEIISGKNSFSKTLKTASKPLIIIGYDALLSPDGEILHSLAKKIAESFRAEFNVLHKVASRVGGLDLGFVPSGSGKPTDEILKSCKKGDVEFLYLLGADEIDMASLGKTFVVYQGHHGDSGAHRADVILPGSAYTEKDATYVNLEGRPQRTQIAVFAPGDAKPDWQIITQLSDIIEKPLGYESLSELRAAMEKVVPHLANIGEIEPAKFGPAKKNGKLSNKAIVSTTKNFYMTDSICRASKTMAQCSAEIWDKKEKAA